MRERTDIKVYSLKGDNQPDQFLKLERMEDHYDQVDGTTDEPHTHDFYTVIWVKNGSGKHIIDFNKYEIRDHQIYFLTPGQIHQIATTSRPEGWVVSFSSDFMVLNNIPISFIENINLFHPYSESPPLAISGTLSHKLQSLLSEMITFFEEDLPFKNEALAAQLRLFLIYCNTECELPPEVENNQSCVLVDFRRSVENGYKLKHKVSDYAQQLSITPKHLNEVIKDALGYTAKEYILDRLIMEAKRLLLHTSFTSKQIAYEIGFKEAEHFSMFFKKSTGLTPMEFKTEYS